MQRTFVLQKEGIIFYFIFCPYLTSFFFYSDRKKILLSSHLRNVFAYRFFCCYANFYSICYILHLGEDYKVAIFHKGEDEELSHSKYTKKSEFELERLFCFSHL